MSHAVTGSVDVEMLEPDDLGRVTAPEAARYFLALARGSDTQPSVEGAVFVAAAFPLARASAVA